MSPFPRLLRYMRPYVGQIAAAAVMLAIAGALMSLAVATLKPIVNEVLLTRPTATEAAPPAEKRNFVQKIVDKLPVEQWKEWLRERPLIKVPFLIVALFLVRGILLYFGEYLTTRTGAAVIRDLRADLYSSLVFQSQSFFGINQTGVVMSRLLNDVQRIQRVSTTVLADLFRVGAMAPAMLILVLVHDWRMTLFAVIVLPLMGYPVVRLGRRLRKASTRSQESIGEAANQLKETVTGIKVVQAFAMEFIAIDRFRHALARLFKVDLQAGRAAALSGPIIEVIGAIAGAALFYIAGKGIASGTLDPGNFIVVVGGLTFLFMSARRLNSINVEIQQAVAAAARAFEMMDWPREVADTPGAVPFPGPPDEIAFENVSFTYPGSDGPALSGVNLKLRRDEMVALVGPSGAGKTTLANLMLRFADPSSGRVTIDGRDLRELTLDSLRKNLGLVTQETILFDATVRANIGAGREDAPLDRVQAAAVAAQAANFVCELPDGYETRLGEDGARLSMGQRQRLTIARALFKNPPFLVLDEATSALDAESENEVQKAMNTLLQGRGSLVIAHRLATIRQADRIVVLDEGRIVEEGDHQSLLAAGGLYARLHALQFQE